MTSQASKNLAPDDRAISYAKAFKWKGEWVTPSKIREARTGRGLSRRLAAQLVNYSPSMWQMWEEGSRPMALELFHQFLTLAGAAIIADAHDAETERKLWAQLHAASKALEVFYANKRTIEAKKRHHELLGL